MSTRPPEDTDENAATGSYGGVVREGLFAVAREDQIRP